jgi:hypothetical protein
MPKITSEVYNIIKTSQIAYLLSQIYKNNKDEDKALGIIEKAIAIYPGNKDLKGEKFNMLIAHAPVHA